MSDSQHDYYILYEQAQQEIEKLVSDSDKKFREKNAEIEKLKAENANLKQACELNRQVADAINDNGKQVYQLQLLVTKLTHQRDTLKKCAEFYADPENYILRNIQEGEWTTIMPASDKEIIRNYKHPETDWVGTINVCGKTARKALQDVEESENEKAKI